MLKEPDSPKILQSGPHIAQGSIPRTQPRSKHRKASMKEVEAFTTPKLSIASASNANSGGRQSKSGQRIASARDFEQQSEQSRHDQRMISDQVLKEMQELNLQSRKRFNLLQSADSNRSLTGQKAPKPAAILSPHRVMTAQEVCEKQLSELADKHGSVFFE